MVSFVIGCNLLPFAASIIIERPSDVEEDYSLVAPLVYHFGHKSPSGNLQLYNALVSRLADIVNMRCETNPKSKLVVIFCL